MDLPEVAVGVLGATGYIGAPYRAEMRACEGVRMVALCARRMDLLEAAALSAVADDLRHFLPGIHCPARPHSPGVQERTHRLQQGGCVHHQHFF